MHKSGCAQPCMFHARVLDLPSLPFVPHFMCLQRQQQKESSKEKNKLASQLGKVRSWRCFRKRRPGSIFGGLLQLVFVGTEPGCFQNHNASNEVCSLEVFWMCVAAPLSWSRYAAFICP